MNIKSNLKKSTNTCWICLENIHFFMHLGVNPQEKILGQNLKMKLSLNLKYENTLDNIENTVDYGAVVEAILKDLAKLKEINLLEYLCEYIMNFIEKNFKNIIGAEIEIEKGYVPLKNFTGNVKIKAARIF